MTLRSKFCKPTAFCGHADTIYRCFILGRLLTISLPLHSRPISLARPRSLASLSLRAVRMVPNGPLDEIAFKYPSLSPSDLINMTCVPLNQGGKDLPVVGLGVSPFIASVPSGSDKVLIAAWWFFIRDVAGGRRTSQGRSRKHYWVIMRGCYTEGNRGWVQAHWLRLVRHRPPRCCCTEVCWLVTGHTGMRKKSERGFRGLSRPLMGNYQGRISSWVKIFSGFRLVLTWFR